MLKLKILNKLPILKLKCTSKFPDVVLANLQEKEVTPNEEIQEVVADKPYNGLSKVTVQPIPYEYIIPEGFREITENGSYNVAEYEVVDVFVPEKILGTKIVDKNGVYNATDDNLDGYSSVNVETSGVDINDYFNRTPRSSETLATNLIKQIPTLDCKQLTSMGGFFRDFTSLQMISLTNTGNITSFGSFANNCSSLLEVSEIDTSKATAVNHMFYNCSKLVTLPLFDFGKVTMIGTHFVNYCYALTNLGGFKDLGKGYTTKTANDSNCQLYLSSCSKLTHESLMNVINNLYDLNLTYDVANGGTLYTQKLVLGSTNINKLSASELEICTRKGWTVS